jgi:phosphoglucosamine mutase
LEGTPITFGTDGVRGVANDDLMPEDALRLGLAAARLFGDPILVGRDTRLSGGMLSCSLAAGAASGGARVIDLGIPLHRESQRSPRTSGPPPRAS